MGWVALCAALVLLAGAATGQQRGGAQVRVYGGELMSDEEIDVYLETLQSLRTPEARAAFRIEHRKKMELRAKEQGVSLGSREPKRGRERAGDRRGAAEARGRRSQGIRPIGWELMSEEERAAYRDALRELGSKEERQAFRAEHLKKMQARAEEQGVALEPRTAGAAAGPGGPGGRRVFGEQLMTEEEIREFRRTIDSFDTLEERREFQQRHVAEMKRRAEEQGVELGKRRQRKPQGGAPAVGSGPDQAR